MTIKNDDVGRGPLFGSTPPRLEGEELFKETFCVGAAWVHVHLSIMVGDNTSALLQTDILLGIIDS